MSVKLIQSFDSILSSLGLVRKSKHESSVTAWSEYAKALGRTAKNNGVTVLFDCEDVRNSSLNGPIFIDGERVNFSGNHVIGSAENTFVCVSPSSRMIRIDCCRFDSERKVTP